MRRASWRALVPALVSAASLAAGCRSTPGLGDLADDVSFAGNAAFEDEALEAAIATELGTGSLRRGLTRALADDSAWALEELYARAGFASVRVDYEYSPGDPPRVPETAQFTVREGPRTELTELRFPGHERLSSEELRASLTLGDDYESGGTLWYSTALARDCAADVERAYYTQGFLDVVVDEPYATFSEDRSSATVAIPVVEGPRYHLRAATFEGESVVGENELKDLCKGRIGEPYTTRVAFELRARIIEILREKGRPDATADFQVTRSSETGDVLLAFTLDQGPAVTIGKVRLVGDPGISEAFVRSRVGLEEGDRWSAEAEEDAFRELYKSGLFRSIDLRLVPRPEEDGRAPDGSELRDLEIEIDELPTLEFYVEPGWGSYELARVKAGVAERNVFGTGRSVSVDLTTAIRAQKLVLNLTDPWFLDSRYSMTYSVFGNRREEPAFTSRDLGVGLTLARRWNERWNSSLSYQFRFSDIQDVAPDFGDQSELANSFDVSSFTLSTARDTRNGLFLPDHGSHLRGTIEWSGAAIGSELDFVRATITGSRFHTLRGGTVLGVAARGGVIAAIGATSDIPLQERFFNGGENTVRSFLEDELGPHDANGDPTGGEGFTAFTVEVRQSLRANLEGALFADAGNLAETHQDFVRFVDYHYGLGAGLRYLLPIGPLRVDWAWNPSPGVDDEDWALHFAVGLSF